jgi:hypothetical protein
LKADYGTSCEAYTTVQRSDDEELGRLVYPKCIGGFFDSAELQQRIFFAEEDVTYYVVAESVGLTPGSVAFKVVEHSQKCGPQAIDTLINLSFGHIYDESV